MKTHMMGVGMALIGMVLMPATGQVQRRAGRGHAEEAAYGQAAQAERVVTEPEFAGTMARVSEQDLEALIPQEEMAGRREERARQERTNAARALKKIGESGVLITEAAVDKTGIFCFRETEAGGFELRELTVDNQATMVDAVVGQGAEEGSLMERIRTL